MEFSGENPEAAIFELSKVEQASGEFSIEQLNDNFSIISGNPEPVSQCAFVNLISRITDENDDSEMLTDKGLPQGSFFIRVKDYGGCHNSADEPRIGRKIQGSRAVTFRNPDFTVRAIHADRWYIGLTEYEKDRKGIESRRAPLRPFFSPIAIHPRYARYLVNITGTKPGDTILDPFCGTGGILLEAGLMGRKIIGNDISLNMVKGARLNLKYFGLRDYTIHHADIADLKIDGTVDGIATDLPYGRNSNMKASSLKALYEKAFERFHEWTRPGSVSSVIVSDVGLLELARPLFDTGKVIGVPQHRSLTRFFVPLIRK